MPFLLGLRSIATMLTTSVDLVDLFRRTSTTSG